MEYLDFATRHWTLFLALAVTLLMLGWNLFGHKIQGYTPVSATQAIQLINQQDAVVVDVREDKELTHTGKITNAYHVPLRSIADMKAAAIGGDLQKPVVVVCRTGNRSAYACGKLRKLGFNKVHNLKGGITSWHKAGYPLVKA